jgi:hypothetical protein
MCDFGVVKGQAITERERERERKALVIHQAKLCKAMQQRERRRMVTRFQATKPSR